MYSHTTITQNCGGRLLCKITRYDIAYFEPTGELFAAMADEPRRHKKKGKKHHHKDHGYPRDVPMRDLQKVRRIAPDGV